MRGGGWRLIVAIADVSHYVRYGSELVNVVADARQEHGPGLGTFGFDDEGVAAQCTPIITNGLFTGYLSSRETAHTIGADRSGGCSGSGSPRSPDTTRGARMRSSRSTVTHTPLMGPGGAAAARP